jgi:hypothetical protein
LVVSLAAGLLLLVSMEARSEFYKYKDSSGAVVITNRLEDVPKKYRNRVKVVWDEELEAKDPVARRRAAAAERMRQQERQEAAQKSQQEAATQKKKAANGKTLVIEMDEATGEVKRRFE